MSKRKARRKMNAMVDELVSRTKPKICKGAWCGSVVNHPEMVCKDCYDRHKRVRRILDGAAYLNRSGLTSW